MSVIDHWLMYLNRMGVRCSHSTHPPAQTALDTAHAERISAHEFAKTVVYFDGADFGIAVVPADEFVDLPEVARVLNLSYIRLATEDELATLFPDCEVGAMPPFGTYCELSAVVDSELARDYIAFTIGTHRDVLRMSFKDFKRLANPIIGAISLKREVHA
jgi:Ala-tRNA(Pro) deacylase